MRCYAGHGGLSDLIQLNQPVLMRLSTSDGRDYSVTLSALDHQTATLIAAGIEQRVLVSDLANSWFGQYVAIWHAPQDFKGNIFPNTRRQDVVWLRHAMEKIDGIKNNGSDVYDADFARRIRAFQLSDGIEPNGIVDTLTVIRLNVRNGISKQHLITDKSR